VNHGDSEFQVGYVDGYRVCWNEGNYQSSPNTIHEPDSSFDRFQTRGIDSTGIAYSSTGSLPLCDSLVNADGTPTGQGDRTVTCIRNGALLVLEPVYLQFRQVLLLRGLQALEGPTGCTGYC